MNLEHDLQRALRRQPGPPDLADRVLARVDGADRRRSRHPAVGWLAAAAAVALVATGGARYYVHQQQLAEAERLKDEIRLALQITSETLAHVQRRVETSLEGRRDAGQDEQRRQGTP